MHRLVFEGRRFVCYTDRSIKWNKPKRALLLGGWLLIAMNAQAQPLGPFEAHGDVGAVKRSGTVTYDSEEQVFIVAGSGANMWGDRDAFHFLWRRMTGRFILQARGHFLGEGVDPHRKLGWIIRTGLGPDDPYVDIAIHGDGLAALQFRRVRGGPTEEIRFAVKGPDVFQLERDGDRYVASVARFGEPFVQQELRGLALGDTVYAGLFVCAHNDTVLERALFDNVRLIVPAPEDFVPYQDYIGSLLEVLDVETGRRKVLYTSEASIQAPNWTPDGRALIYNQDGLLYRFDLATRRPSVIPTGFATQNNNDHVLSPDGRWLGLSHHAPEHGGRSIIYVVPIEGGTPRQVTPAGPSYLHGWSPDGRYLVYTAERDGEYDIYRIPVEGGEEVRLTHTPGLDDGPEYSPDGQYIYFNSVRSGTMQIWRMRPDGTEPEQLTDDAFNNWFPHVSPDGRWVLFLSYLPDVDPSDHPFYRPVYLRLMPAASGSPRVVAYLYGGQGTLNVNSWAPDSRHAAFVSNSDKLRP